MMRKIAVLAILLVSLLTLSAGRVAAADETVEGVGFVQQTQH